MPGVVPRNPWIFHITHLANLASIRGHGCLWSDSQRIARNLGNANIGYTHLKQRRLVRDVPSGGKLGDYVPFYFCSRSVMLYVVHRGHDNYTGGQEDIVHLVSRVRTATGLGKPWTFTDKHAELAYANYFTSLDDLIQIDWSVMPLTYWRNVVARRQAEFLVRDSFPWSAFGYVGVKSPAVAAKVQTIVGDDGPQILVRPKWYY